MRTADDIPPKIVFLLDNGTSMEQIYWHEGYDNGTDYTPDVLEPQDVIEYSSMGGGNGFFNENGYGIINIGTESNRQYCLGPILENLEIDSANCLQAKTSSFKDQYGSATWTIKEKTMILPSEPSSTYIDGVIDKAVHFRYSKNYLNWLFFYKAPIDSDGDGIDDTVLPNKSRFYFAKKAIMTVAKKAANKADFGLYTFDTEFEGAKRQQPVSEVVSTPLAEDPINNTLTNEFYNNVNKMETTLYSPLAEGLASVGGEFADKSTHVLSYYCDKLFTILITPGVSSENKPATYVSEHPPVPDALSDYDNDGESLSITISGIQYTIPTKHNGSTYLDDVAQYLFTNDIPQYVDADGFQNVRTYTVGFMGTEEGNRFLINASNNGNGNFNLYDETDSEYGKYHFVAESPGNLSETILAAVNDILDATSSFTAPVVPVTRTTSGDRIYMAFFKPKDGNFWEGNVTKFGIADDNTIIDVNGNPATWPNGAIREDAIPYWQTKDWGDPTKTNYYIHNTDRKIYTYLRDIDLPAKTIISQNNEFADSNNKLTEAILGNPTHLKTEIINFVRGADVFDEDKDGDTYENRMVITGDVLHSEPLVVNYKYSDGTSKTIIYFGANDGMLHAVLDETGEEAWAFIPPDQLNRLKYMVERLSHQYYVDSSPKVYFYDVDADGIIDTSDGDKIILICGERKGGTSYFALDVTYPLNPVYMWRIDKGISKNGVLQFSEPLYINLNGSFQDGDPLRIWDDWWAGWGPDIAAYVDGIKSSGNLLAYKSGTIPFRVGQLIGNLSNETFNDSTPYIYGEIVDVINADPDVVIPELGESWSEPVFGMVKTTDYPKNGIPVFFIGAGYSTDNSSGAAVLAIDVFTGQVIKKFKNDTSISGMNYSIASTVNAIDENGNGFVDKVYVGDLGGQMWRIGKFTDTNNDSLSFPESDENIMNWSAQILFASDPAYEQKFYYPPSVTLEKDYDLVFAGTGNREDPCNINSYDRIYSIKDTHSNSLLEESDLVDVTDPAATVPNIDNQTGDVDGNYVYDQGWYVSLAPGEKFLAEGTVFYKTFYFTTFTPNNDPCLPGGIGKAYALNYKTAAAAVDFDNDTNLERSTDIGGGTPSKVVTIITDAGGVKLLISVGSTIPDAISDSFGAGVVTLDPLVPPINFFYLWWREVLKL
jgi:type IV pilus assembly protein PilY1